MVVFVVTNLNFPSKRNFVKEFIKLCPEVTTVVFNENSRKTNVILGEKEDVAYGKGFIFDSLLGINFKISSKSFYQVNHDQCEVLYSLAINKAQLEKNDKVLDAYCGIGTIGLIVSKQVNEVVGVEIVKDAIIDAKENAKLNNIKNANFICKEKGLDSKFLNSLIESQVKKIVYISCDVGTFSRDISILRRYYNIDSIDFVDMFPRTYHIETVCRLSLK